MTEMLFCPAFALSRCLYGAFLSVPETFPGQGRELKRNASPSCPIVLARESKSPQSEAPNRLDNDLAAHGENAAAHTIATGNSLMGLAPWSR